MRDRIQSGGWRGGGATSWDQREAERGVRKMGLLFSLTGGSGLELVSPELGKSALR